MEPYEDMGADEAQKALQTLVAGFYFMMNSEFRKYNYQGVDTSANKEG